MINCKTEPELQKMRRAGEILFQAFCDARAALRPGVSTWDLDQVIDHSIRSQGGIPTEYGYHGFPASACVSIDDEVVHGIPLKATKLKEGQIVTLDVTCGWQGFQVDAARTFPVGEVSTEARLLMDRTRQAFYEGLAFCREGLHVSDISKAIQGYAESFGYGVIRSLCGHGIGQEMHEDPEVPNFYDGRRGARLRAGMTIAVEPMISAGTYDVYLHKNRWTYLTCDHSLAAHYENTVLIKADGTQELLTIPQGAEDVL